MKSRILKKFEIAIGRLSELQSYIPSDIDLQKATQLVSKVQSQVESGQIKLPKK